MANDKREKLERAFEAEMERRFRCQTPGDDPITVAIDVELPFKSVFASGYDAARAAATAEGIPQADGWVDVADRLPDGDFTEYLICLENKSVFRATYLGKKEWLVAGVGSVKDHNPVIAWQPLPAPYQR